MYDPGRKGGLHGGLKQLVRVGLFSDQAGMHAPRQVHLPQHGVRKRAAHNGAGGAVFAQQAAGGAAQRHGDDRGGVQIVGGGHGRVRDRLRHRVPRDRRARAEAGLVVDRLFGRFGDQRHGLHSLHRELPRGGLARKHNGAGAVVNGVRHVRDLGAGGARVRDHALQHLRGGDHLLAGKIALADDLLLDGGDVLERDLYA